MRMPAKIIPTGRLPVRIRTQTGARCIASHYNPGNSASKYMGISFTELARRLRISVSGVGYSVERGEIIARENDDQLVE